MNDTMKRFEEIQVISYNLAEAKNKDYGDSFQELWDELGPTSALVRLHDKLNRLTTLMKSKEEREVDDESIEDTLIDLSNYAILTLISMGRDKE